MTRKEAFLMQVARDAAKYGHITNETKALMQDIRCSKALLDKTINQGRRVRDEIHKKHQVWELQEINHTARESIRRHLSCGERLDTTKGQKLIDDYHNSMDNYHRSIKEAEKDFEIL